MLPFDDVRIQEKSEPVFPVNVMTFSVFSLDHRILIIHKSYKPNEHFIPLRIELYVYCPLPKSCK